MKVVIATPLYPPEIGGPATYAKLLCEGLPQRGIEVELVKFSDVRHLPNAIRQIVYCWKLFSRTYHADLILALDAVSVGWPAYFANLFLHKKFVVKIVGDHIWEQGKQRFGIADNLDTFPRFSWRWHPYLWFLRMLQFRVARSATRVIVPSEYLKKVVMAWGVPEERISVIYNSTDLPAHIPTPDRKENEFLIVSAGRRVPWKGFEAIEQVARKHNNWRVFIASGLPRTEALGWMRAADVFVLNSRYEGFPHALIEAMMLGTPVIATRTGGNTELIEDGRTGILISPDDDAALDRTLATVASDPDAAHARARAAQERAREFSIPRMIEATAALLISL